MLQIAICDDEPYMIDLLAEKVLHFFSREQMEICISRFSSGEELLAGNRSPEIVFLDVQMAHPDGFETAKELRNRGFSGFLIFVTVMQEDVFRAFEVQAFDYLIKPLQESAFTQTMDRLLQSLHHQQENHLLIQRGTDWTIIPFEQILYCEVINRKIYLHLNDASVVDYYEKMEHLEQKLDQRFFKCHRSYLINLQYLKSYETGAAHLTSGDTIPVSRLRKNEFSNVILQYMKQRRFLK